MARNRRGLDAAAARTRRNADETAVRLVRRILEESSTGSGEREETVSLADVSPAPWQTRQDYGEAEIGALAESIEREGLLQPPVVRPDPDRPGRYQLICGHRRVEAMHRIAAGRNVPAEQYHFRVRLRECGDVEARILTAIENVHRKDLTPYEFARTVCEVWETLRAADLPHTDRDMAPLLNLRSAGAVSEYRRIGQSIDEQTLHAAGLVRECGDEVILDWELVGRLTKDQLLTAAKAHAPNERLAHLRRAAAQAKAKDHADKGKKRTKAQSASGPRYTAEDLWEHGRYHMHLTRPFRSYSADESRRYLRDLLPAVSALLRADAEATGRCLERVGPGLIAYVEGHSEGVETLEELQTLVIRIQDTIDDLEAELRRALRRMGIPQDLWHMPVNAIAAAIERRDGGDM